MSYVTLWGSSQRSQPNSWPARQGPARPTRIGLTLRQRGPSGGSGGAPAAFVLNERVARLPGTEGQPALIAARACHPRPRALSGGQELPQLHPAESIRSYPCLPRFLNAVRPPAGVVIPASRSSAVWIWVPTSRMLRWLRLVHLAPSESNGHGNLLHRTSLPRRPRPPRYGRRTCLVAAFLSPSEGNHASTRGASGIAALPVPSTTEYQWPRRIGAGPPLFLT